jgi:hypothetical protein
MKRVGREWLNFLMVPCIKAGSMKDITMELVKSLGPMAINTKAIGNAVKWTDLEY